MTELERIIYDLRPPIYDDYALSPLQLERSVKDGNYKVHLNMYDEKVFGPPVRVRRNKKDGD